MRIFKNHYSAVFVFILTGLFFLPANGNSDVVVDPSMSNAPMSGDTSGTLPTADNSAAPINEGRDMDVGSHRAAPIGDAEESGGPAAQHMNREINDGGFGANSGAGDDKARIAAEAQAAEQAAQSGSQDVPAPSKGKLYQSDPNSSSLCSAHHGGTPRWCGGRNEPYHCCDVEQQITLPVLTVQEIRDAINAMKPHDLCEALLSYTGMRTLKGDTKQRIARDLC